MTPVLTISSPEVLIAKAWLKKLMPDRTDIDDLLEQIIKEMNQQKKVS